MKFAVSNIALPPFKHDGELHHLANMGLSGLEVAPSRIWKETWTNLKPSDVETYRNTIEAAGLSVVGLHSLFFDHPELGLFRDRETRAQTLDFLVHLSGVCRDLGGRTLIYGGGRKRGELPETEARAEAVNFAGQLCHRIKDHGTCICFEPLGPTETDFIHSVFDSLEIVKAVDHPALRVQLDAKALVANEEAESSSFEGVRDHLVHFHANEPGFDVLGATGSVDHASLGKFLRQIDYTGYVSIEQRMLSSKNFIDDIATSTSVLKECYQ